MEQILAELAKIFPQLNTALASGIYVFARMIGFFRFAPVFNRKEVPGLVKLGLAFLMTIVITSLVKPQAMGMEDSLILSILLNFVVGAILGYMAQLILQLMPELI